MKYRLFILLLTLLFGLTAAVTAQNADFTTTFTRNATMRSAPDQSATSLGVIRTGTTIRLDGRNTNGNWVRGITSSGQIGWVSSGTISISLGDLTGLRVITPEMPFTLSAPAAAATAAPVAVAPAASGGVDPNGLTVNATANVNIRSGAGTGFRRLDRVDRNTPFTIDGRDPSATWVRGVNQRGIVGWASVTYLAISRDQINALPVVSNDTPFTLAAPAGAAPATVSTGGGAVAPVTPGNFRGFAYGGHIAGFDGFALDWMRNAGMTWIKTQVRYSDGQDPASIAGTINAAHGNGFRILLGVVGNPGQVTDPAYFGRYANFVAGLAALGADAIEIWNEPNIDREWAAGAISPASYTELLRQSYNAIKNSNPNTLVISGAPAPTGFFGGCGGGGCDDNLFMQGMAAAGAANYMDCIGVHYNEGIISPTRTSGDPRNPSDHYTRYYQSMMNVYSSAFGGARPLCFTEMGFLSPEGYGPLPGAFGWAGNVTVGQQAEWIDQAISIAANSGRVRLVIIWNINFTNYDDDPMAGYALIRPGGDCPACRALAN